MTGPLNPRAFALLGAANAFSQGKGGHGALQMGLNAYSKAALNQSRQQRMHWQNLLAQQQIIDLQRQQKASEQATAAREAEIKRWTDKGYDPDELRYAFTNDEAAKAFYKKVEEHRGAEKVYRDAMALHESQPDVYPMPNMPLHMQRAIDNQNVVEPSPVQSNTGMPTEQNITEPDTNQSDTGLIIPDKEGPMRGSIPTSILAQDPKLAAQEVQKQREEFDKKYEKPLGFNVGQELGTLSEFSSAIANPKAQVGPVQGSEFVQDYVLNPFAAIGVGDNTPDDILRMAERKQIPEHTFDPITGERVLAGSASERDVKNIQDMAIKKTDTREAGLYKQGMKLLGVKRNVWQRELIELYRDGKITERQLEQATKEIYSNYTAQQKNDLKKYADLYIDAAKNKTMDHEQLNSRFLYKVQGLVTLPENSLAARILSSDRALGPNYNNVLDRQFGFEQYGN